MTERRARGSGSIYKRADGYYVGAITLPASTLGDRRRKVLVRKKRSDVVRGLRELRAELDRTGDLTDRVPTVETWMETWITRGQRLGKLRPKTVESHRGNLARYIAPAIGRHRLDKLTAAHIEGMTSAMVAGKLSKSGKPLKYTTALQAHNIVKGGLESAMRAGHVSRNVAVLAEAPVKDYYRPKALSGIEAVTLLEWAATQDAITDVRINIALWAGLRQGEALGLTREHVDLDGGFIHVVWQLQSLKTPPASNLASKHLGGSYYLTEPKSKAGVRHIPIARPFQPVIERRLLEMPDDPGAFFVVAKEGGPLEASRDSKQWHKYLDAAGVGQIKLHEARHTTATLMRAAGASMVNIQAIVGHSAAKMTEHYAHQLTPESVDTVARYAALMEAEGRARQIEG